MCESLISDLLAKLGLTYATKIKQMPNGEIRASIEFGGLVTIITLLPKDATSKWQDPHFHRGIAETYVVGEGAVLLVDIVERRTRVRRYTSGNSFTVLPNTHHNIRISSGTVISTTKHGTPVPNPERKGKDWYPSPELVEWHRVNSSR